MKPRTQKILGVILLALIIGFSVFSYDGSIFRKNAPKKAQYGMGDAAINLLPLNVPPQNSDGTLLEILENVFIDEGVDRTASSAETLRLDYLRPSIAFYTGGRVTHIQEEGYGSFPSYGNSDVSTFPTLPPIDDSIIIIILTPADGAKFELGESIDFTAEASDKGVDISDEISWEVDGFYVDTGPSLSLDDLDEGLHIIAASVIDDGGNITEDVIAVAVDAPLTISILTPADGAEFELGESIDFTAEAFDKGIDISDEISWEVDGEYVGIGPTLSLDLIEGLHTITASVMDDGGNPAEDVITIAVAVDAPPTISILTPADGAKFEPGEMIGFSAQAFDEGVDISDEISWKVDWLYIDSGPTITLALAEGLYTISASVMDDGGNIAEDVITVAVAVDVPPTILILTPADGAEFESGEMIDFTAEAFDEGVDISDEISWEVDGFYIDTGPSLNLALAVGLHTISASVMDDGGNIAEDVITVAVAVDAPPTISILTPADGAEFESGEMIDFTAEAFDKGIDISDEISWEVDGFYIGSGPSLSLYLEGGLHTITASVMDDGGNPVSDSIGISVMAGSQLSLDLSVSPDPVTRHDTLLVAAVVSDANGPVEGAMASFLIEFPKINITLTKLTDASGMAVVTYRIIAGKTGIGPSKVTAIITKDGYYPVTGLVSFNVE